MLEPFLASIVRRMPTCLLDIRSPLASRSTVWKRIASGTWALAHTVEIAKAMIEIKFLIFMILSYLRFYFLINLPL